MAGFKKTGYYKVLTNTSAEGALTIKKFNGDLDLESEYVVSRIEANNGHYYDCNCPAAVFNCRHKKIIAEVQKLGAVDSPKFFNYETMKLLEASEVK